MIVFPLPWHYLNLLEQSWCELLPLYADTPSTTCAASLHMTILGTRALTGGTNGLLLNCEFRLSAIVKVTQGNSHPDLHVRYPSIPTIVSKVSRAAEEAREEVKGIVLLPRAATLLVLLNAFMTVLIINLARLFLNEDLVCFSNLNEFLVRRVVATALG